MKLSALSEVYELDERLQQIDLERKKLADSREISIRIADLHNYSEAVDCGSDAGRSVVTAFDTYLDWLEADIKERLKELGVEP